MEELGISERLQQECNAVVWDPAKGIENISQAEQAKVGVVYAEYGLTESGGVVLFSAAGRGRSLSLLPEYSLFILMGGYVSGPGGLAAWSLGIPVVLHEQNGIAGLPAWKIESESIFAVFVFT